MVNRRYLKASDFAWWITIVVILLAILAGFTAVSEAKWFTYEPPGAVSGKGIVQDVLSRCDTSGKRTVAEFANDPDGHVTYCHEGTHMLNSRIRQEMGGGPINCFYVGGGRFAVFREPRTTLRAISKHVARHRNSTYNIYFGDMLKYWNEQPLYIFDEWSAYINGSQTAVEFNHNPHGTHERAQWFCHYADAVIAAVKQDDPQYKEMKELEKFVEFQKQRVKKLTGSIYAPETKQQTNTVQRKVRRKRQARPQNQQRRQRPDYAQPVTLTDLTPGQVPDLAPRWRQQNERNSCVYASVVNCMRWLGMHNTADRFWARHRGDPDGEKAQGLARALDRFNVKYTMTTKGDEDFLLWAASTRRGAGVTWGSMHMITFWGIKDGNAVLQGNAPIGVRQYKYQPWKEFLAEWRRAGGWAVVILDGEVPPPVPVV